MREVDPVTQCEIIVRKRFPLPISFLMYASIASSAGLIDMPKAPKKENYPPWYSISLSKSERELLSYEEAQELKRYKWTLKQIRDREMWPGMIS